jgi:hypothetical protein
MNLLDIITKGSTDRSVVLRIIDETTGVPELGVVFNTSGIALWYRREGAAKVDITEATLAALTTAHTDGGFLHIADGEYRLDPPDAAFATGANYVDFGGAVTGMIVIGGRVRLVDFSLEVAELVANATRINGSATAAQNLERSALAIYRGSVTGSTSTTTLIDSGLTQSGTDHWKGRIVIFTTGTLAKQATNITAFTPASDLLTFTALTAAPSNGDEYVIV